MNRAAIPDRAETHVVCFSSNYPELDRPDSSNILAAAAERNHHTVVARDGRRQGSCVLRLPRDGHVAPNRELL